MDRNNIHNSSSTSLIADRHIQFMHRALELAEKARGKTSPNPLVGAVVVRGGKVVGEGFHTRAGKPHAEIEALKKAGLKARTADLYINLEPCCYFGRTPPCTEAIIQAGIKRVFVGMKDPNPKVSGKGFRFLRAKGISVVSNILKDECLKLNESFLKVMKTGMPYVILKSAMSLDGKIAANSGDSKWISGKLARRHVHNIRSYVDAIVVGTETVIKDNPDLTCRLGNKSIKNPVRIILDRRNRIPLSVNVFKNGLSQRIICVAGSDVSKARQKSLAQKGIEVLKSPSGKNGFKIKPLLQKLARKEINSILLEGGSELSASFLKANAVDRVIIFLSPILLGGSQAVGLIGGKGVMKVDQGIRLENFEVSKLGEDLMVEGTICLAE